METIKDSLVSLPHEPGVYIYRNTLKEVIYVGKAVDLYRRVHQYFQSGDTMGDKTKRLVSEIAGIETIRVTSEFDALLLEAKLIRSYMPKFNVISRDDKSYLYVAFTLSETLPRILFLRKGQLPAVASKKKNCIYGPFQSSRALRALVRQVRSAVPYCTQKERNGKPCFYTHIGLCDPCPSVITKLPPGDLKTNLTKQYRKNLYQIKAIFDGKTSEVRRTYEKEMNSAAASLQFERAAEYKRRIDSLYTISAYRYDPAVFLERGATDIYEEELVELLSVLQKYYPALTKLDRIECFDMSQLFGTAAVGSMVVLAHGKPDTSEYRRFRIKASGVVSDTGMMREVLTRRFRHTDWPIPDFVLIDGGKPQLSVAAEVFTSTNAGIPYAGLAKRQEELVLPQSFSYTVVRLPLSGKAIKVLERVRDEAHRFVIRYHRLLREKATFSV